LQIEEAYSAFINHATSESIPFSITLDQGGLITEEALHLLSSWTELPQDILLKR